MVKGQVIVWFLLVESDIKCMIVNVMSQNV
jgi:hypothetical protein